MKPFTFTVKAKKLSYVKKNGEPGGTIIRYLFLTGEDWDGTTGYRITSFEKSGRFTIMSKPRKAERVCPTAILDRPAKQYEWSDGEPDNEYTHRCESFDGEGFKVWLTHRLKEKTGVAIACMLMVRPS